MKNISNNLIGILCIICYITGIVLAKGFWSTLCAIIIFPYSWYLVIEKVLHYYGVI